MALAMVLAFAGVLVFGGLGVGSESWAVLSLKPRLVSMKS